MDVNFKEIYQKSISKPEEFWSEISNDIFWFQKPTKILNKSNPPFYKWFEDGKTNTCLILWIFIINKEKVTKIRNHQRRQNQGTLNTNKRQGYNKQKQQFKQIIGII